MRPQIKLAGIRLTMAHSESQAFKQGQSPAAQAESMQEIKDVLNCLKVCLIQFAAGRKIERFCVFVSPLHLSRDVMPLYLHSEPIQDAVSSLYREDGHKRYWLGEG